MGDASGERTLTFDDNEKLRELVGEFGAHLKMVSRAFDVEISQRGNALFIGPGPQKGRTDVVEKLLLGLHALIERGFPLHPTDVDHAVRILRGDPKADVAAYFSDTVVMGVGNRPISPRTPTQRAYVDALRRCEVVFGVGPAGTGKTYLAMAMAVSLLLKGDVKRIVLTRPAVEAGEKLGFLPGDLTEKIDPYLRPLYDALQEMVPADRLARLNERRTIEVAPLAFMRGRTISDAFIILDEAQNTTVEQMKMFLTRLGENSRMVITGDVTQIDLPPARTSGLVHALRVMRDVPAIETVWFGSGDVVRHPLVGAIIEAYDRADRDRREGSRRDDPPREAPEEP